MVTSAVLLPSSAVLLLLCTEDAMFLTCSSEYTPTSDAWLFVKGLRAWTPAVVKQAPRRR